MCPAVSISVRTPSVCVQRCSAAVRLSRWPCCTAITRWMASRRHFGTHCNRFCSRCPKSRVYAIGFNHRIYYLLLIHKDVKTTKTFFFAILYSQTCMPRVLCTNQLRHYMCVIISPYSKPRSTRSSTRTVHGHLINLCRVVLLDIAQDTDIV